MISLLCPTRGRPDNIQRLIASASVLASHDNEFVFYLDADDPAHFDYERVLDEAEVDVTAITGERIVLSEMWNRCAAQASYDILMHAGDDIVFRTPAWDEVVLDGFARFPDHIVFAHGDDGHWGQGFGTHGFVHRLWVDTLGYLCPPYFSCDWNDTWLNDVANMIGRRLFLPIITEHLHPAFGTAPLDQTHQDRMARGAVDNVDAIYAAKLSEREADAAKLRRVIERWALTDGALANEIGGNGG